MIVQKIQPNYTYPTYINKKTLNKQYYKGFSDFNEPANYGFPSNHVSFAGNPIIDKLLQTYLKRKTYRNSIKGSHRPYLSIDKNLEQITQQVKIMVNPLEKIEAWDINPHLSSDYVIFLHGFSQNITNNQPLYKELVKTRFGILSIDYRGYGKNPPSPNISEDNIIEDVHAAVKYLNKKGVKNIGIIGHSFGAYIGAKFSKDNNIKFFIMVSPMHSLEFWLKNVIKHPNKYKFEYSLIKYYQNFQNQYKKVFDINEHLKNNPTTTYVIQSNNDKYVRTSKVNTVVQHIKNLKQYIKIKIGGHRMDDEKIREIKNILDTL